MTVADLTRARELDPEDPEIAEQPREYQDRLYRTLAGMAISRGSVNPSS